MKSVLVVYSGGLDSFTLLNEAINKFERVEAITFNYGQKHNKEIDYAARFCAESKIPHEIVNLDLEKILSEMESYSDYPTIVQTSALLYVSSQNWSQI